MTIPTSTAVVITYCTLF